MASLLKILINLYVFAYNEASILEYYHRSEILPEKTLQACDSKSYKSEYVQVPTLTTSYENTYSLETYKVIRSKSTKICPDGDAPINDIVKTLTMKDFHIQKTQFDLDSILRQNTILLADGYLGVPDEDDHSIKYYNSTEFCLDEVEGKVNKFRLKLKLCPLPESRPVFRKCCPMSMVLDESTFKCVGQDQPYRWDNSYMDAKTGRKKEIDSVQPVFLSPVQPCSTFSMRTYDQCNDGFYPTTDNKMALVTESRDIEYWKESSFCMEKLIGHHDEKEKTVLVFCANSTVSGRGTSSSSSEAMSYLNMISLYIGSLFHLMTTLVYLITWSKQNIHGKTLCACTCALFFMQVFLGTAHLLSIIGNKQGSWICFLTGVGSQFFTISAFVWLAIVNFNLWRKFREVRVRIVYTTNRFKAYCGVGCGLPLLISIISINLDLSFPCRTSRVLTPEFGKVICFVAPWAQGVYVLSFLGVSMGLSFVFAGLAVYGLLKVKIQQSNLRTNGDDRKRETILLFLKLSVVMGISWIFEVIGWAVSPQGGHEWGWIVVDLYNALSPVAIFVIFVCKRSTLTLIEEAVPSLKRMTANLNKMSTIYTSTTTILDENAGSTNHKEGMEGSSSTFQRNRQESNL